MESQALQIIALAAAAVALVSIAVALADKLENMAAQARRRDPHGMNFAAEGTPDLQDEAYIRNFLEKLLKGGSTKTTSTAAPKAVAKSN